MLWGAVIVFAAALVYLLALWLSIRAKAPEAMLCWALCFLVTIPFMTLIGMRSLGWITALDYSRYIRPFVLPSFMITWLLPPMEWVVRLMKANRQRGNVPIDTPRDI